MHRPPPTLLLLLLAGLTECLAQAPTDFTPPGPNLALHRPYTLDPAPNYGDCSLDPQHTILTDGEYTKGYFWVQKTTVGWVHQRPVAITVDLGQVQPIAGAAYHTAAGVADVTWPLSIALLVSDEGKQWTMVGDLVALSNQRGAPPEKPYRLHTFATGAVQAHGRYVALVVDQAPYMVVDEVEVYQGRPEWLSQPLAGTSRAAASALEFWRGRQVVEAARARMRADLAQILAGLDAAKLSAAEKAGLRIRADQLTARIEAVDELPDRFTTILPLSGLHAAVYALQAPLLRARGYRGIAVWGGYRYDLLQPLDAPPVPPAAPPSLSVRMMRREHRAEVLNVTNPTDAPLVVTVKATGLGPAAPGLALREVLFTDTRERTPIASAILPGPPADQGLQLTVPAGLTRQVWLDFDTAQVPAGDYRGTVGLSTGGGSASKVPLSLHVAALTMPSPFSCAIGGWDETNNKGGYQVTAENMSPLIANLRAHGVNMPWSNPQVMPTPGQYDAAGNLTAPPDFTAWDEWVKRWQGAPYWGLFPNVRDNFAGEPLGTPRFNKMVGAWITAWVQHAAAQGIQPARIMILLVDEPSRDAQDQTIITWAKALQAAQPEITIWNDPTHADPAKVDPEFYAQADVLCPNTTLFLRRDQAYRDFYVAQRRAGRQLWFYSCSGPSKLLDPASYYRGQFWLNLQYGGQGSCYWAFGDERGFSWNAYVQPRACYSPLFLSPTAVTDAKQMEAIREGAEDYETFKLLEARVAELERQGGKSKLLAEAKTLLTTGPAQVVATMGGEQQLWVTPKDRTVADRLRLRALDLLERLSA